MHILWGALAFALFFLGDCNDWKWERAIFRICFPVGMAVLTAVTVGMALDGTPPVPQAARTPAYVLAAVFLALLIYTLFFALPAGDAYVRQEGRRPACRSGVYALCRHPGVLWLAGLYVCLWFAAGVPLAAGALYSALNLLLVWFEDAVVFPVRLEGYDDYRRETPFLIPNRESIRACRVTF